MKKLLFALSLFAFYQVFPQCVAPFEDINRHVFLFDAGQSNFIEGLPVTGMKVGRAGIAAYVPQNGRLKMFYKGQTYTINDNAPNYYMTDNWFLYQNYNQVKVFYDREFRNLENFFRPGIDSLYYSDSLIAWTNTLGELNVFYDGTTQLLERTEITRAKAGDNIFAYVDRNGLFKVFYHGQLQTLETYEPRNFLVDRDMIMYIDWYNNFKFFHDGELTETTVPVWNTQDLNLKLERFLAVTRSMVAVPLNGGLAVAQVGIDTVIPISTAEIKVSIPIGYWTGEGFAAYVSQLKQLVVYYKGEETILMSDWPTRLVIKENIIAYTDKGNNFWCWYKGKIYWLERYIPYSIDIDNDIIVYQDLDYRLKAFYFGEQVKVSDQMVKKDPLSIYEKYKLWNESITYSIMPYQTKVWCNKKTYTFE